MTFEEADYEDASEKPQISTLALTPPVLEFITLFYYEVNNDDDGTLGTKV